MCLVTQTVYAVLLAYRLPLQTYRWICLLSTTQDPAVAPNIGSVGMLGPGYLQHDLILLGFALCCLLIVCWALGALRLLHSLTWCLSSEMTRKLKDPHCTQGLLSSLWETFCFLAVGCSLTFSLPLLLLYLHWGTWQGKSNASPGLYTYK